MRDVCGMFWMLGSVICLSYISLCQVMDGERKE